MKANYNPESNLGMELHVVVNINKSKNESKLQPGYCIGDFAKCCCKYQ